MDYNLAISKITKFMLHEIKETRTNGVIFGLSGGIDSAVLVYLCKRALQEKALAIIMPDTDITPKTETEDALKMIALTGIEHKLIDINPIVREYSKYLEPDEKARGNIRARIRTNILYYYANVKNYLVLGSSDKSEYLLGYFTKFGDGAADLTPLISLYKTQIRMIARSLDVPQNVILKKSSPHLWRDHSAEDELGATYEEIDSILYCLFERKISVTHAASVLKLDRLLVEKIHHTCQKTAHKRLLPSCIEDL